MEKQTESVSDWVKGLTRPDKTYLMELYFGYAYPKNFDMLSDEELQEIWLKEKNKVKTK